MDELCPNEAMKAGEAGEKGDELAEQSAEGAAPVVVRKRPVEPTLKEIIEHSALHEPYRSWCPECVGGRGVADQHLATELDEGALAKVGLDYGYLSKRQDGNPILAGKDSKHRWYYAFPVPCKGASEPWIPKFVSHSLSLAGHRRFIIRTDSEVAILALKKAVMALLAKEYGQEVLPEDSYYDSQGNGLAELAVQVIKAKMRVLGAAAEKLLKVKLEPSDTAIAWLTLWAAMSVNIGRKGPDGRTAWELRHGKPFKRPIADFGERVLYRQPGVARCSQQSLEQLRGNGF